MSLQKGSVRGIFTFKTDYKMVEEAVTFLPL